MADGLRLHTRPRGLEGDIGLDSRSTAVTPPVQPECAPPRLRFDRMIEPNIHIVSVLADVHIYDLRGRS
jgi:hypothetical protein